MHDGHTSHKAWHLSQSQVTQSCDTEKIVEGSGISNII